MVRKDFNYKIVRFFLNNSQLTILGLVILLVVGSLAAFTLRTEGFPAVPVPYVIVNTVVPGAGPETVTHLVTAPLEAAVAEVKDVTDITSTSRSGISTLVIQFESGTDINERAGDIKTEVDGVSLPEAALDPIVFVPETGGAPFIIAAAGDKHIFELLQQDTLLEDELIKLDGVQSVTRFSNVKENIYIELLPQYQTPSILDQINASVAAFPLGEISKDGDIVTLAGTASIETLDQLRSLPITVTTPTGANRVVALRDIGSIYTGIDYGGSIHRVGYVSHVTHEFEISGGLLYEVQTKPDTDILDLNKELEPVLEQLGEEYGMEFPIVYNQAEQSQRQIDEIMSGAFGAAWHSDNFLKYTGYLFGGMWLLVIALLLLLDWRSALISIITIPLSFLFTFGALWLMDIQFNTIVLFSLVLVLGLIVDPAIVVLEAIKRYTEIGFQGKDAALRAIGAVGRGLFVAVLTSFIVFVPFGIVGGTFGAIIKYIPLTIIPALIASYIVPMVFLTWLGVKFLKPTGQEVHDEDDITQLWSIARFLIRINRGILRRRWLQIVVIFLGVAIPVGVIIGLFGSGAVQQVQFSQSDDIEFLSISVPVPSGATNQELLAISRDVESIILTQEDVLKTLFYFSFTGDPNGSAESTLEITLELVPLAERNRKSGVIADAIQEELTARYGDNARAQELSDGPPEALYPVTVTIFDTNEEALLSASKAIAEELKTYEEVAGVRFSGEATTTELVLDIDTQKAAERGLTSASIYGQIAGILGERTLFELNGTDVIVRLPDATRPTTETIHQTVVYGSTGPVRLGDVATLRERAVADAIRRFNSERFVTVDARVNDTRDAITVQRRIDDWARDRAPEFGLSDRAFEDRGAGNEFEESFAQLFQAIAFSIIITYVVFVVFFRSFVQPFIILFSVPLIMIGAMPALVIFARGQFGFLETLGLIMLIGIVENVAIFLLDFANQRVEEGMDKKEAIALSSGIRLRPVVLTQLTSLAGLLPLAVFSPFWRGLAVVVIAGIITSGIFSLITTPVLYSWLTRRRQVAESAETGEIIHNPELVEA